MLRPLGTVLLAGTLLLSGCGLWGPEGGPLGPAPHPSTTSPSAPAVDAVAGPDGVQRVQISLTDDLKLMPDHVRARTGVIELTFHNAGITPHAITLGQRSPGAPSPPGTGNLNADQTATIRLTIDRPGRYPYPCQYHSSTGMQGTLDVTST
jgi:plastocyanin